MANNRLGHHACEMFPLIKDDADNPMELFQIWLNLPPESKMVPATSRFCGAKTSRRWQADLGFRSTSSRARSMEFKHLLPHQIAGRRSRALTWRFG